MPHHTHTIHITQHPCHTLRILTLRRSLECVFANGDVSPFKPSKIIQNRPPLFSNLLCPVTHGTVGSYGTLCRCCGRQFSSGDYVAEHATLLQLGSEEAEKVCGDCKLSQMCVLYLKMLNYTHLLDLHDLSPAVLKDTHKFKASFKLRRRQSARLDMAADLYEGGNLTAEEFEELREVDHAYRRELRYEEGLKLKNCLDAFQDDMQTLLSVLMDSSLTDKGGVQAYMKIVLRIFEVADTAPDLVDFFFPQLLQVWVWVWVWIVCSM